MPFPSPQGRSVPLFQPGRRLEVPFLGKVSLDKERGLRESLPRQCTQRQHHSPQLYCHRRLEDTPQGFWPTQEKRFTDNDTETTPTDMTTQSPFQRIHCQTGPQTRKEVPVTLLVPDSEMWKHSQGPPDSQWTLSHQRQSHWPLRESKHTYKAETMKDKRILLNIYREIRGEIAPRNHKEKHEKEN